MLTLAMLFDLLVAFVFPLGALLYFIIKRRSLVKPWLLGLVTFLVFQFLTRIPLLQFLSSQSWFTSFAILQPVLYSLLLGLSAGVFEEAGRYIVMRLFMKRNLDFASGVSFGIGHGGFEAIMLVGINYLLLTIVAITGASFSPNLAAALSTLQAAGAPIVFMAGLERAFTLVLHIGWSVMVLRGIRKKQLLHLVAAILTHGLVDGMLGIWQMLGWNIFMIEAYVAVCAVGMLVYIVYAYKKEKAEVRPHEEAV